MTSCMILSSLFVTYFFISIIIFLPYGPITPSFTVVSVCMCLFFSVDVLITQEKDPHIFVVHVEE